MTTDETLKKLTDSQEETRAMLAQIVESIRRLERIALSRVRLDDVESTLVALEGRTRKPR